MDYNGWLVVVTTAGWRMLDVPEEFKTYELGLAAVTDDGWAIQYVPKDIIDYDMCLVAVTMHSWAIRHVPENYKTFELLITIYDLKKYKKYINWELLNQDQTEYIKLKYGI